MFERWRQENFFKYLRQEYLIDALVDYQVEPDDPTRLVPNPARKALDKELRLARASFTKLQERFGVMALDYVDRDMPQAKFQKTEKKLRSDMEKVTARIHKLEKRRAFLPPHLPLGKARKGPKTPRKTTRPQHLSHILRIGALQIPKELGRMILPPF